MANELNIDIPSKLLPFFTSNKRYNVAYGGRGGSKSWTIALLLLIKALNEKCLILCTREVQNTIRDSVHRLLSGTIYKYNWDSLFDIQKDKIICLRTGAEFIFKGLRHNITEIKSTEGIDHCWIEEAHSISRESLDILLPTIRKENSQFWIIFNPDQENDPVYQEFVLKERPDSMVIKINYDDNPFFPDVLKKEMEYDKEFNYDKYLHVWEGQIKQLTDSCVFRGKFTVQNFETPSDVEFYYGADWGFAEDPAAGVRCFIKDRKLYIDYECGGTGVDIDELPQIFDTLPGARDNIITADSQRPDTISYMNKQGFVFRSAKKGRGSIEDGIEFLKSFEQIIIHERCVNTIYEFKSYSYKKDRHTDEILPVIVDKDNHWIDSLRYATERIRKGLDSVRVSKVSAYSLGL